MKKFVVVVFFVLVLSGVLAAQSCDILYLCVNYDGGEVDCSDRFTAGNLTVMALLSAPIYYTNISIQLDKYNAREGDFEYYENYPFDTDPEMDYIFFPDIAFNDAGFYRVFLLDPNGNTITSTLVEITR